MYRGRRLDRLGSQTLGSVGLPGNGDPCLLALLWNRNTSTLSRLPVLWRLLSGSGTWSPTWDYCG